MVLLTLFSHCFIEQFQCYFHHSKLNFIIINTYEHFKIIELNTQLNKVESLRTYCCSDSSVSNQLDFTSSTYMVLSIFPVYYFVFHTWIVGIKLESCALKLFPKLLLE